MPSPTQRMGYAQEEAAEQLLSRLGYAIVERNWRGAGAEVDRIAWDDDVLCFVEVRARSTVAFGRPEETIGPAKRRHLVRAAMAYLMRFSPREVPMVRFDVVAVVESDGDRELVLFKDAFEASG